MLIHPKHIIVVSGPRRRPLRMLLHLQLPRHRSIHIIDPNTPIRTPRIHVPRVGTPRRRKVTAYQRLQYLVSAERDDGPVVGVRRVLLLIPRLDAVIEARGVVIRDHGREILFTDHFAQVPQLHRLVFSIAEDVPPVPLAVHVRETLRVPNEHARFPIVA